MKTTFTLPSTDLTSDLNCVLWQPTAPTQLKGVFQIIHGMAEYASRYDEFAEFLNQAGYLVIGHDHLGHGMSSADSLAPRGYFTANDSPKVLVDDAYAVTSYAKKHHPDLPYYVLGHSMGSFVLRNYLKTHSHEIQGAIIMGTGGYRGELKLALPILRQLNRFAPKKVNHLIDKVAFGNFSHPFPEKGSAFTWLSKNQLNVQAYEADPLLGFVFTNNGFYTLFKLMATATEKNWFEPIERELPLLIISGEQDPVGNFGKAPREIALSLAAANFKDVTLQLYPELRHEILNEKENELVMNDLLTWLNKH